MLSYSRSNYVGLLVFVSVCSSVTNAENFTTTLTRKIQEEQVLVDQPYVSLESPEKIKGLYNCYGFLNFHGEPPLGQLRQSFRVFDSSMFTSALVAILTLEAFKEGAPRPTDQQIDLLLDALQLFHDKNLPDNTSILAFNQAKFDDSNHNWYFTSVNFVEAIKLLKFPSNPALQLILDMLGRPQQLLNFITMTSRSRNNTESSTFAPADFDCTFINLALGAQLYQQREEFSRSWDKWKSHNSNLTLVFRALKKYAYRPFSRDSNSNSIDPRTHFYLRGFLDKAKAEGRDVALVTTWIQNIDEARESLKLRTAMPYLVNNVDVAVAIDVIYGLCAVALSGLVGPEVLDDPDIQKILLNTTSLVAYEIAHNFSNRPDLALFYYPSSFNFFMFVAKTVELLHSARQINGTIHPQPLESVYQILREAVDGPLTNTILSQVKKQGSDQFYFEDFLGNGDTLMGDPVIRGEDRIFTTAAALNALLSAWTEQNNSTSNKHNWRSTATNQIKEVVAGCVRWLRRHTLSGQYAPNNALFSTTVKGFETVPFWYPANRIEYLNGSTISDFSRIPSSTFLYAYEGYVPADQYASQVNQTHFGVPTPTRFHSLNGPTNVFPLWNTVAYTFATTLLAVAKYDNIL